MNNKVYHKHPTAKVQYSWTNTPMTLNHWPHIHCIYCGQDGHVWTEEVEEPSVVEDGEGTALTVCLSCNAWFYLVPHVLHGPDEPFPIFRETINAIRKSLGKQPLVEQPGTKK